MVDKCSSIKSEDDSKKQSSLIIPKVEGELYKIVKLIKEDVDDFCEIKDEAKKIPSPHCSLIIHSSEKEKGKKKPTQFMRLRSKNNKQKIKQSSSEDKDKSLFTPLHLFKKTLIFNDDNKKEDPQKFETAQSSKNRSVSPKSRTDERKSSPVRHRTPSPQTRKSPNKSTTKKSESPPKDKSKLRKNQTESTQPKNKLQLFPFGKIGTTDTKKNKKLPQSSPDFSPMIGVETKKKESNESIPTETTSRILSVYKSLNDCSKSDLTLQSCKSEWLIDEIKNSESLFIIPRENSTNENSLKALKLQFKNSLQTGTSSKMIMTDFTKRADKAAETCTSHVETLEKEIRLVNFLNNKSHNTKEELINKNTNVKNENKLANDKQNAFQNKGSNEEENKILQGSSKVSKIDELKSPHESTKSAKETDKYATEPTKSAKEPTKPRIENEKFATTYKENQSNNKMIQNRSQSPNVKRKITNPPKFVQVLKWDKRILSEKVNWSLRQEENNPKNILATKRSKSLYHNMCTISRPVPSENDVTQTPIPDELRKIKAEVDQAVAQKKIFTVCGNYVTIRRALIKRGWVEKLRISYRSNGPLRKLNTASMAELLDLLKDKEQGSLARRIIVSKMLANYPVDLFWDYSNDIFKNSSLYNNKFPLINRLRTGVFGYSSKSGLCDTVKKAHWYQIPGMSCLQHPRTYNFAHSGDPHDFLEDYKRTAAMSVLKWIVERSTDKVVKLISNNGKIPLNVFEFAIIECKRYLKVCNHKDIDLKFSEASDFEWHQFFENFYALVHLGEHFKSNDIETVESLVLKSKIILARIRKYFPYLEMDDTMNIWILKPCNGCRGIGIHLCRTLEYILTIVKNNPQRKYVIQKYIERPLLIYHTKFDIRQWFLISNTNPLTLWIYKECYVRLSSQTFNIRKLHESIHLTNNSIQARYKNLNRDPSLPNCNMWTLTKFKKYLALIGHPNAFDEIIYPGMKQNITCAILANQDRICRRKNTFEIYGSDFMITEDFKPWLLEINCRPALYASTSVTAKLCPKVLEDTIKVVIDHERNREPNSSNFELLYKEKIEKLPQVNPESFVFHIRPLTEDFFVKPEHLYLTIPEDTKDDTDDADLTILSLKSEMKQTLERLLGLIKTEKEKRTGVSCDSLTSDKINKQVQSQTNTLGGALKDVTVIMNLDHVQLPCYTNSTNNFQIPGGIRLMQNEIFNDESEDEENDSIETKSSNATKALAKTMISGFLHELEKLE